MGLGREHIVEGSPTECSDADPASPSEASESVETVAEKKRKVASGEVVTPLLDQVRQALSNYKFIAGGATEVPNSQPDSAATSNPSEAASSSDCPAPWRLHQDLPAAPKGKPKPKAAVQAGVWPSSNDNVAKFKIQNCSHEERQKRDKKIQKKQKARERKKTWQLDWKKSVLLSLGGLGFLVKTTCCLAMAGLLAIEYYWVYVAQRLACWPLSFSRRIDSWNHDLQICQIIIIEKQTLPTINLVKEKEGLDARHREISYTNHTNLFQTHC